jgi:hypothetical protein
VILVTRRNTPTPEDRVQAIRIALHGISTGADLDELRVQLAPLHPPHDTFPGEMLLELAADAIEGSGASRAQPIEFEQIRERYLPERGPLTKTQHHKSKYAIRAAAMIRAGVDPGLLDEVGWWSTDDLWVWALDALIVYVRVAADRLDVPIDVVCERLAAHHEVKLSASR